MRHLAFVIAVVCVVALWTAASSSPRTEAVINVTQVQTRHVGYGLIPRRQVFGDGDFWLYLLYNKRITQAAIGYSTLRCEFYGRGGPLGSGVSECWAIYSLAKGKLIARGLIKDRSFYVLALTGGTGFYSGARGQVVVTNFRAKPHTERLLFSLEL